MKKLYKSAIFTDIHFGRKNNGLQHNEDCTNFIDWFCTQVVANKCDHVLFLGDWYENRSSLNISTLAYSHAAAKKLNELNIPIFFCIGNHDLYQRHTRDIYSTVTFSEFTNFNLIDKPTTVSCIGDGALIVPFLFHDEYDGLKNYKERLMSYQKNYSYFLDKIIYY